jgi:hypothetical protein
MVFRVEIAAVRARGVGWLPAARTQVARTTTIIVFRHERSAATAGSRLDPGVQGGEAAGCRRIEGVVLDVQAVE